MAITSAICNSFKQEILEAEHNFTASTGNTFNLAYTQVQRLWERVQLRILLLMK